ncbi:MAG TPA: molybdate ABC transporter substrate-binding protein [Alphaproteobacteria bacterium]|nr:molybdate ABC transporter substrate-binding protein [Alphaproteobacteria bacterium]
MLAFAVLLAAVPAAWAQGRDVLVFAAASLKNALDDVSAQYRRETGKPVTIAYGASSALARQIEAGAPAGVFISADLDWMDYLEKKGLVVPGTRRNLLGNALVMVAPKTSSLKTVAIAPGFALAALLKGGKLAMADTAAVPAGKYGKAALERLGVWVSVRSSIAQAENVRAALALVARDETPLGIVYATDAAVEPRVRIVGVFPADTHPPIVYPAALIASGAPGHGTADPDAAAFLAYVESAQARPLFERQGFTVLK